MSHLTRPASGEFAEFYAKYVDGVPDGDIVHQLKEQLGDTVSMLENVSEDVETYRYAPGKWSLREVIGHMIDTERLFAYRAMTIAREDGADLPGMDQIEWADRSNAGARRLSDLLMEWISLRRSNVHMFATFPDGAWTRRGTASGSEVTVRGLAYVIAGHELWHREHIREHYLGGGA